MSLSSASTKKSASNNMPGSKLKQTLLTSMMTTTSSSSTTTTTTPMNKKKRPMLTAAAAAASKKKKTMMTVSHSSSSSSSFFLPKTTTPLLLTPPIDPTTSSSLSLSTSLMDLIPTESQIQSILSSENNYHYIPLTTNHSSWIVHIPKLIQSSQSHSQQQSSNSRQILFHDYFQRHPIDKHPIYIYGKQTYENRYSQMYMIPPSTSSVPVSKSNNDNDNGDDTRDDEGISTLLLTEYKYSGTFKKCFVCDVTIPQERFVVELCRVADYIYRNLPPNLAKTTTTTTMTTSPTTPTTTTATAIPTSSSIYNGCLVNWYEPNHTIGLHADDEKELDNSYPIMSLSWGGPRRFLLRPKKYTLNYIQKVTDILLKDGDWIIMGGKCQEEFKHEIPKLRKCDGPSSKRISWTIRKMINPTNQNPKTTTKKQKMPASLSTSKVVYNPYAKKK